MQVPTPNNNTHLIELEHFKAQVDQRKGRMKASLRKLPMIMAIAWWPGLVIIAAVKACRVFWYEKEIFEITFTSHLLGTAIFAAIALFVWAAWMTLQWIALASDRSDQEKLMWEAMMGMQRELNTARESQYPPPPSPPVATDSPAVPRNGATLAYPPASPTLAPPPSPPAPPFQDPPAAYLAPPVATTPPKPVPTPSDRTVLEKVDQNLSVRFTPRTYHRAIPLWV